MRSDCFTDDSARPCTLVTPCVTPLVLTPGHLTRPPIHNHALPVLRTEMHDITRARQTFQQLPGMRPCRPSEPVE